MAKISVMHCPGCGYNQQRDMEKNMKKKKKKRPRPTGFFSFYGKRMGREDWEHTDVTEKAHIYGCPKCGTVFIAVDRVYRKVEVGGKGAR